MTAIGDPGGCGLAGIVADPAIRSFVKQQLRDLALIPLVHDLGGGQVAGGIHAHVQRSVGGIAPKPAHQGIILQAWRVVRVGLYGLGIHVDSDWEGFAEACL